MRRAVAVLGAVLLLLGAQQGSSAAALVSYDLTICAPLELLSDPTSSVMLRETVNNSYSTQVNLVESAAEGTGVVRAPDGCWRFQMTAPDANVTLGLRGRGVAGALVDACRPGGVGVSIALPEGERTVRIDIPSPHLVELRSMNPSGEEVLGVTWNMFDLNTGKANRGQATVTGATTRSVPLTTESWWSYGTDDTYNMCFSGTSAILFDDPAGNSLTGRLSFSVRNPDGSTSQQSGPFTDDFSDGVLSGALPYDVPVVEPQSTSTPSALSARGAAGVRSVSGSSAQLSVIANYGSPVSVPVTVTQQVDAAPVPVAGATVAVRRFLPRGAIGPSLGSDTADSQGHAEPVLTAVSGGTYLARGANYSSGVTRLLLQVRPQAPQKPTGTPSRGSAVVRWARGADGGSPLTSYTGQWRPAGATAWTSVSLSPSATSWTKSGLTNGKAYELRVLASSAVGSSPPTAVLRVIPGAPTAVSLTGQPRSAAVALAWPTPTSAGGYSLAAFELHWKQASASTWSSLATTGASVRSYVRSGLVNGRAYDFRIRARNAAGFRSTWSHVIRLVPGTPTTPRSVAAKALTGAVGLTWAAPAAANGAAVSGYRVQYRAVGGSTWTSVSLGPTARSYSRAAATGAKVELRVAARNTRGLGPFSGVVTSTSR